MLSYHNDPAVKAKYIARFAEHRRLDQVIQGRGFEGGRGCFVGCTLDDYDHSRFPVEMGWPVWFALLADTVFEGLPLKEAIEFGTHLLAYVPVGVDLELVRIPFLVSIQLRNLERLSGNQENYAVQCRAAIQGVIDALLSGKGLDAAESAAAESAWAAESAESAGSAWSARAAAESAESAESAGSAWAARAAWAWAAAGSAGSAARAAESAAESAAWAESAGSAARSAEYQTQSASLLSIIRDL